MSSSGQTIITDHLVVRKHRTQAKTNKKQKKSSRKSKTENNEDNVTNILSDEELTFAQDMKKLRQFDLDHCFGPSLDSSRMERWERAQRLGLEPPTDIKACIEKNASNVQYTHSVWHDHRLLSASLS